MPKTYVAPELRLAGDADEVVLGGGGGGLDFGAEEIFADVEFLPDGEES